MCDRCKTLEKQLLRRPQRGDVEHMRVRLGRQTALYEAVLARNEVLKRRLDEMAVRCRMLESKAARDVVSARATTQEE